MRRRAAARAIAALLAALLAASALGDLACARMRPDLTRLYHRSAKPRRPVILIPGVFGSRLRDGATGRLVWARMLTVLVKLYKPNDQREDLLDLPIDAADPLQNRDGLLPDGVFDRVAGRDFYRRVLDTLQGAGGYKLGDIRHPSAEATLYAFDYDWRRDGAESAARLADAVDRILAARAEPGGQVDILGHSLGGLVARYYIRYGRHDVLAQDPAGESPDPGARRVHMLIHLGTPNAGTLDALRSLVEGFDLGRLLPPEAIFTMPAAWQLLTRPGEKVLLDAGGETIKRDLFDVGTWDRYGWSVFDPKRRADLRARLRRLYGPSEGETRFAEQIDRERRFAVWALSRARRFIESLASPSPEEDRVREIVFGGDCLPTPAHAVVIYDGERFRTSFDPATLPDLPEKTALADLMLEPGDGTVTRTSLMGGTVGSPPGAPLRIENATFLCENHRRLTENVSFQDNLLHLLLERGN